MFFSNRSTISPQKAHEIMGQADPYLLLDVRTPEEYKQIRIDGAKLLPVDELARRAPSELPDKNILILIYCQSGMRATQAVKILTKMGYTNVVSFGGIINWRYGTTRG